MVDKKLVVLCLVCVVLAVGLVGALMLLNQQDAELQIRTNQVSELENDKLGLAAEVSNLQYNLSDLQSETVSLTNEKASLQTLVSSLQTEVTALESENDELEMQISPLQTHVSSLQTEVTSLEGDKTLLEQQVFVLQTNVSSLQTEVTALESENDELEMQISPLQTHVSSLQTEVTSLEGDKTLLEQQVFVLQTNVSSLQTQIANLTVDVVNLEAAVNSSYYIGYDDGYAQGTDDFIQCSYCFTDPTYDEAIAFINSDETDENAYTPDYVCYDFTADFISNADQVGYRVGFVYIEFANSAHAITCFNTTDVGLIYVEPQNDEIVDVGVGQIYLGHVIVKMGIIW